MLSNALNHLISCSDMNQKLKVMLEESQTENGTLKRVCLDKIDIRFEYFGFHLFKYVNMQIWCMSHHTIVI